MKAGDEAAIRRFQDAGGLFGVCTGRSLKGVLMAFGYDPGFDFYILASGALIVDRTFQKIYVRSISRALTQEIYDRYRDAARVVIQANDTVYSFAGYHPMQTKIADLSEIPGEDIYGFSFGFDGEAEAGRACEELNRRYAGRIAAFQNVSNVDIVADGCSKGSAVALVKAHFRAERIGGIGDSFNDIPMLERADTAFTFPFAPPEAQAQADHIVESVAEALEIMGRE